MKITLAEGMHYCHDCNNLILDDEHESVWFCDGCAYRRGANIIDGRPVKIKRDHEFADSKVCVKCGWIPK